MLTVIGMRVLDKHNNVASWVVALNTTWVKPTVIGMKEATPQQRKWGKDLIGLM